MYYIPYVCTDIQIDCVLRYGTPGFPDKFHRRNSGGAIAEIQESRQLEIAVYALEEARIDPGGDPIRSLRYWHITNVTVTRLA